MRETILERGWTVDRAVALADALEAEGYYLGALRALERAVEMRRDTDLEKRLVRLRNAAFEDLDRSRYPGEQSPVADPDLVERPESPRLARDKVNAGRIAAAIQQFGFAWIPEIIPEARVIRLRERIDAVFESYDARKEHTAGHRDYDPQFFPKGERLRREMGRRGGGTMLADAPRALHEFLETIREAGLVDLVGAYLGEPPILSAQKTTARRINANVDYPDDPWHQDGAFMGSDVRSINIWITLSDCGRDAPGLEVMPVHPGRIVPTGEQGSMLDWTVSPRTIEREFPGVEPWRPQFRAGDALLFDHFFLHRTAGGSEMPDTRYAIESWFFAPSGYPEGYTPLVV